MPHREKQGPLGHSAGTGGAPSGVSDMVLSHSIEVVSGSQPQSESETGGSVCLMGGRGESRLERRVR